MESHQGQSESKGSAVLARLHATGDVEERLFLSALLNDDLGHIQRLDGDSATKTDRRRLRFQQTYSLWEPHRSESDRCSQSGIEWFGASLLWLDLRSLWPVRHNGGGLHPRSPGHYGAHTVGEPPCLVRRSLRPDVL